MENTDWFEIVEVLKRREIAMRLDDLCPHASGDPWEEVLWSEVCMDLGPRGSAKERSKPPPPWLIGLSKQFKKDTSELDRKLLGRVLEVFAELSELPYPFEAYGDTFKPLKGEFEGYWRYRIGDSRLIIEPKPADSQINVLALGPRGGMYD